jgi:hypothetical protein
MYTREEYIGDIKVSYRDPEDGDNLTVIVKTTEPTHFLKKLEYDPGEDRSLAIAQFDLLVDLLKQIAAIHLTKELDVVDDDV